MNDKELNRVLRKLAACTEAVEWARGRSFAEAWQICERADWMLWLCGRMAGTEGWPTRQEIVLFACDIAEEALPHFAKKYPNDNRPKGAIEAARRWAKGEDPKPAAYAAYAAYAAADAYAAAAADAYAAYAAAAAWRLTRNGKLKELANRVRERLTVPGSQAARPAPRKSVAE